MTSREEMEPRDDQARDVDGREADAPEHAAGEQEAHDESAHTFPSEPPSSGSESGDISGEVIPGAPGESAGPAEDAVSDDHPPEESHVAAEAVEDPSEEAEESGVKSRRRKKGESARAAQANGFSNLRQAMKSDGIRGLWQQSSTWHVTIAAVILVVAIANAGYFLLVRPAGESLAEMRSRKELLHDFSVIQECGAAIGGFREGLMTGDQRLTVLSEVQTMAREAGVSLVGDPELLSPREVSKVVTEYPIRLRVKGGYHDVGRFLSALENSPRFVLVEEVEITSEAGSRDRASETTIVMSLASWED